MERFTSAGGGKQLQCFRGIICFCEFKLWEHSRMTCSVTKWPQNPWLLDKADRSQLSCRNQPDAVVSHMASYVRQNRVCNPWARKNFAVSSSVPLVLVSKDWNNFLWTETSTILRHRTQPQEFDIHSLVSMPVLFLLPKFRHNHLWRSHVHSA